MTLNHVIRLRFSPTSCIPSPTIDMTNTLSPAAIDMATAPATPGTGNMLSKSWQDTLWVLGNSWAHSPGYSQFAAKCVDGHFGTWIERAKPCILETGLYRNPNPPIPRTLLKTGGNLLVTEAYENMYQCIQHGLQM